MARFSSGDRVAQSTYGTGTVTSVNEYHTTIKFDDNHVRTFATSMVRLDPSDTPAPPPPPKRARKTPVKAAVRAAATT